MKKQEAELFLENCFRDQCAAAGNATNDDPEIILCNAGWDHGGALRRLIHLCVGTVVDLSPIQSVAIGFLHFGIRLGRKLAETERLEELVKQTSATDALPETENGAQE